MMRASIQNQSPHLSPHPLTTRLLRVAGKNQKLVCTSRVLDLFKTCQNCGSTIISTKVSYFGAQIKASWDCLKGHSGTWKSSPDVRGMPEVDLLAASSVLFTGSTITELEDFSKLMNLKMISPVTFYKIQRTYLFPAIEDLFTSQRQQILAKLFLEHNPEPHEAENNKAVVPKLGHLSGDGRYVQRNLSQKF